MGYSIQERSQLLAYLSEQKWLHREKGAYYNPREDKNFTPPDRKPNICKNQPKQMIKYINIQNALCPMCTKKDSINDKTTLIVSKCSPKHLEQAHSIHIEPIENIIEEVMDMNESNKYDVDPKHRMTRKQIMDYAKKRIKVSLTKLKNFLKTSKEDM